MRLKKITSKEDIIDIVSDIGFLPFFANEITGFSIEEHIAPEYWFDGETDGVWEWKGDIASSGKCIYGKLFRGRAGFVSLDRFGDFANYRRDGYDYERRPEESKKRVYNYLIGLLRDASEKQILRFIG